MRRALGILVFSFAILATGPHADARGGGGGFGGGFAGGFRGLAGQPPAFRPFTGLHGQSGAHRTLFAARRFHGTRFGARRGYAQGTVSSGWWPWWSGDNGFGWYWPAAEPPQPEVIVIQTPGQGPRVAEPAPDYSYAGCHAIPNGYYCDVHKRAG